jgi:hypothetical protein
MKSTTYDLPPFMGLWKSRALRAFLHNWFEDSRGLVRHEVDLSFLSELRPRELAYARNLLRRNLHLGYAHIVEGIGALGDTSAVPVLRQMLHCDEYRGLRLTIAGTLWRLTKDEAFYEALLEMKDSEWPAMKQVFIGQVPWLADGRALDMLIDFLEDSDAFVRYLALGWLHEIEFEKSSLLQGRPHRPLYYQSRRHDEDFRTMMIEHLKRTAEKNLRNYFGPLGADAVLGKQVFKSNSFSLELLQELIVVRV